MLYEGVFDGGKEGMYIFMFMKGVIIGVFEDVGYRIQ